MHRSGPWQLCFVAALLALMAAVLLAVLAVPVKLAEAQSKPTLSLEHKRYGDDPNPGQVWNTVTSAYEGTTADDVGQIVSININLSQARSRATKFKLCVSDESTAVFRTSPDQIRFLVDFDVINTVGNANSLSWTADNRRQLVMDADNCHDYTIGAGSTLSWVMLFIHSDSVKEGDETAVFELKRSSDTDSGVAISSTKGKSTFTITNDDGAAPTFTLEGGAAVPEGTRATFTLKSDMTVSTSPQVIVKASDGGRGDFVSPSTENNLILRNFPTGVTQTTFTVPTVDDSTLEPHGAVKAEILPRDGYVVGNPGSATVTVIDNDEHNKQNQAKVSLSESTYEVLEGQPARIEVTLDKARSSDTAVTLTKTAISPTTAADFGDSNSSYTVTVPATETSATVDIPTATDSVNDHGDTFRVAIQSVATGTQKGSVTQAVVTIQEPAVYQMARGFINVQEGGENWVDVTRTKGLSSPASTDITLKVKPGTATAGADYTPDVTTINVKVNLVNNKGRLNVKGVAENMIEGPETFTVELTDVPEELAGVPESATKGGRLKTTVQIVDVNLVPSDWALIPSGVNDGDQFRLLFVTSTGRTAESADISVYDTFVRDKAKVGHTDIRPYAEGFQVVGSVVGMPAHIHTATSRGTSEITRWSTPIYWLNGKRIATGHNVFWSNNWTNYRRANGDLRNASGNVDTRASQHWTGTNADGTASTRSLGGGTVGVPQYYDGSFTIHGQWGAKPISHAQKPKTETRRLLGISQIFEVTENPILSISAAQMEVTESGSTVNNVQFTLSSTPAPESDLTVSVSLQQDGDYTNQVPADGNVDLDVTIPANSASVIFQIPLLSDGGDEPDGILAASISSTSTYRVVGGTQRVEVTLKDDDDTQVALTTSRQWMNETGSDNSLDLTLTLSRPAGSRETVIIPIRVSQATAGADYTMSLKTGAKLLTSGGLSPRGDSYSAQNPAVEFSPGSSSATITFTAVDDSVKANRVLEFGYGFNSIVDADDLGLGGGGMTLGNLNRYQQATILDDENTDPVEVTFSIAEFQFVEGNGSGAAPVIFFSRPVDEDVTVRLNLTAGTATKGVDYIDADHINFLVLAGKTVSTRTIRVYDDTAWEVDEIFNMAIDASSLPAGFILGDKPTATVKILDDETAQNANINHNLTIENLAAQTTEGGSGANRVAMTFSIMPATDGPGKVSVCLSGTATPGEDYRFRTNGQGYQVPDADGCVVAGLGASGATQHYLEIIDDSVKEVDETIILTLRKHPETISDVGVPQTATTHTIVDNDDPAATFETAAQQVQESAGSVSVPLAMTPLGPDQPTTVNYQVVGMTATAGSDYTAPSGSVTVPAGSTSASIPINLVDDSTAEFPEEIMVKLSGGTGYQLGERQEHEIEVVDSDPGVLVGLYQFLASVSATATCADLPDCIVEGDSAEFRLQYQGYDIDRYSVMVSLTTSGTARRGADYTIQRYYPGTGWKDLRALYSGTFEVENQGKPVRLRVLSKLDNLNEGDETITITIGSNMYYLDLHTGTHLDTSAVTRLGTVTFTLSEGQPTVSISGGARVTESQPAEFTVTANSAVASDLPVTVNVTQQGDFAASPGQQTATIPRGQTSGVFQVALDDDYQDEGHGSVTVTVQDGAGYMAQPGRNTATVEVRDNDPPVISVSGGSQITEGGTATFTLTADPAPQQSLDVTVSVTQQGDYLAPANQGQKTITIPANQTSVAYNVPTTPDNADEIDGAVIVTLQGRAGYEIGARRASVAVQDDDQLTISVEDGPSVVTGDPARFTVVASLPPTANLVVRLNVTQQGGVVAAAHRGQKQVTIPAGKTRATYSVPSVANHQLSGSATVTVVSGSGYAVSASDGAATVLIDDNLPRVSVSHDAWVPGGGTARFIVTAQPDQLAPLTVTVVLSQQYWQDVVDPADIHKIGTHAVTIPIGGRAAIDIATTADENRAKHGAITAEVTPGSGYLVSATESTTVVSIRTDDPCWYGHQHLFNKGTKTSNMTWTMDECHGKDDMDASRHTDFVWTSCPVISRNHQTWALTEPERDHLRRGHHTIDAPYLNSLNVDQNHYHDGEQTIFGDGYCGSENGWMPGDPVKPDKGSSGDPIGAPGKPTFSGLTSGSVTVSWPQRDVDHYLLYWGPVADGNQLNLPHVQVDSSYQSHTITGLEPGTRYGFSVYSDDDQPVAVTEYETTAGGTTPPPATPEVSITADGDITEGGDAGFTVTADPAPAAALDVDVAVTQTGDYGVTPGSRTVTIPTTGSATLTIPTGDDSTDEADGSVTATVNTGQGYTVSATAGSAIVAVSDDDATVCTPNLPSDAVTVSEVTGWRDGHSGAAHVLRWSRVLAALGVDNGETPLTVAESRANENTFMRSRWDRVTRTLEALEQCAAPPPTTPVVSITADGDITEGGDAGFTVSTNPAPTAPLDVTVNVAQTGDYGVAAGSRTVTIPTSGSATITITTSDDSTDEADGSVTATVNTGQGYTVSATAGSAIVAVSDDDATVCTPNLPSDAVTVSEVTGWRDGHSGAAHVLRWSRVLAALGVDNGETPLTVAESRANENTFMRSRWDRVTRTLEALEQCAAPPPATPVVSITADGDITEGGDAGFTVTANPIPTAPLDVTVNVAQTGDFGVTPGSRTVTIPTGGSATLTITTSDDSTDEADGSVTATVNTGQGYTVSATAGSATVSVADDDTAPPPPPATPEVSITAGNGITEGGNASFTVTANPAPAASLDVTVGVTQTGDFGVAAGSRTVTVPTGGSVSLTVTTSDDSTDEADGSIRATIDPGQGYTVSATAGSATVSVADDDTAPPPPPATPEVSITAGPGVTEGGNAGFTVTANPAPTAPLDVTVAVAQTGDYGVTPGSRTVTIPTTGSATLTITTSDDRTDEPDGSITATVNTGQGYTVSATAGSATVDVADDDDPSPPSDVSISIEDASELEGGEVRFKVTLSKAVNHDVWVWWESASDYDLLYPAQGGLEFWFMEGWLFFAPGETEQEEEVFLNDDSRREQNEAFLVKLSKPEGATIADGEGVMTIIDDD